MIRTHVYKGSMPCGCVCAQAVDMPEEPELVEESLVEFTKCGYTITKVPIEEQGMTRCAAHKDLGPNAWRGAMEDQRIAARGA